MLLTLSLTVAAFAVFAIPQSGNYGTEVGIMAYGDYQYESPYYSYIGGYEDEAPYDDEYHFSHYQYNPDINIAVTDDYATYVSDNEVQYTKEPTIDEYIDYIEYVYTDIEPTDGYIGIMPLTPPIYLTTITNLAQLQGLQALINGIPTTGATAGTPRLVRFNFPGGILTTSAHPDIMPTINITGNRHIILDGNAAGVHQRWNRDGTTQNTGRHFNITGGASLELLNVNISRPLGSNPTVMSGGINVSGTNSTLRLSHPNARISNNRTNHAGGGVFVNTGGRLYMHNGSIDGNSSFVDYGLVPPAHGDGGGVIIRENSFFEMTGGRIHNNESRVSGAGAFILHSEFRMYGGYIENNRATGDGGGLVISNSIGIINNGTIRNNTADIRMLNNAPANGWGGGVLVIGNGSNLTMHNGAIYQNRTYHGGGGVWVGGGTNVSFTMHGGVIRHNRYRPTRVGTNVPIPQGGGIWLNGTGCTVNLHGGSISNNHAIQGGGVRASGGSELQMLAPLGVGQPVSIYSNSSPSYGGGVFVIGTTTVFNMRIGRIFSNTAFTAPAPPTGARGRGGGVYVDQSTFNMYGGTIGSNNPLGIDRNMAAVGGGVYVRGGASFNMLQGGTVQAPTSGTISGNLASQYGYYYGGAGVLVRGTASGTNTTFDMQAGRITNNAFTRNRGGGVFLRAGAEMTMSGGSIDNNFSRLHQGSDSGDGGGIAVQDNGTTFIMTGGTISDNTVGSGGGGILVAHQADFDMQNGNILDNTSSEGGGVWVVHQSTMNMDNGLIAGNTGIGGGVQVTARSTFTMNGGVIEDNNGLNWGGGVFASGGSVFSMFGNSIIRDNAATNGGGVSIHGGASPPTVPVFLPTTFTLTGGTIGNTNRVLGNTAVRGGGMHIYGGAAVTINASTAMGAQILGNTATGTAPGDGGGGIFLDSGQLNITGGTVGHSNVNSGNTAMRGGGIYMSAGTTAILNSANAHIAGNNATGTNFATDGGGGVFLSGGNTHLTLQNGLIIGNRASHGGGIRLQAGTGSSQATAANPARFTMTGGIINNNRYNPAGSGAISTGGGVFASGLHSIVNMSGGIIGNSDQNNGNRATDGGGIAITGGAVFILQSVGVTGAQILGNTAINSGGGAWVAANSQLNFTGGTIGHVNIASGNTATRGGGAYARDGAIINMTNVNARISSNSATGVAVANGGGGIYIHGANTHLNLENGTIEHNRATRGGGVYVANGTASGNSWFNMSGGNIRNNRVNHNNNPTLEGGGVFISGNNAQFNMTGGNIGTVTADGNRAVSGGGVFATNGTWFDLAGGNIRGNEAEHGGGVFITGVFTGGTAPLFTMSSGSIGGMAAVQGNVATATTNGSGGGVRVHSSGRFYMTGGIIQHNSANRGGGAAVGGATAAAHGALISVGDTQFEDDYDYVTYEYEYHNWYDHYVYESYDSHYTTYEYEYHNWHDHYIYESYASYYTFGDDYVAYGFIGIIPLSAPLRPALQPAHTMTMRENAQIVDNIATAFGGGVHVSGGAVFSMSSGTPIIATNTAQGTANNAAHAGNGGGGVFVTGAGSHFMFAHGGIHSNRATRGGGIRLDAGTATGANPARVTMTGGAIRNHRHNASGDSITAGGGVYISGANAVYTMYHGSLGGMPISVWPFPLNQANTFVDANVALNGGGVAVTNGGHFIMSQGNDNGTPTTGTISGNVATDNSGRRGGGGVLVDGTNSMFTLNQGRITRNTAEGISTNDGGGGILIRDGAQMVMNNGVIDDNVAAHGAGVRVMGIPGESSSTFTMHNGTIEENRALAARVVNQLGVGGGVHVQNANFTMNGGQIRNNRASGGGGVRVWGGNPASNFIMNGGYIRGHNLTGNGGTGNGGGVSITNVGGFMRMYGGIIGGQPANLPEGAANPYANIAGRQGGGVHVSEQGVFTMSEGIGIPNHGVISHNSATTSTNAVGSGGGGVSVEGENTYFNMYIGTIQANSAQLHGGGVHIFDGGMFNLRSTGTKIITANQAIYGGGIWLGHISVTSPATPLPIGQMRMQLTPTPAADGVHITNNIATFMGGGIYTMLHCYNEPMQLVPVSPLVPPFMTNTAIAYSNITLVGVTFSGNSANKLVVPPSNRGILTNLGFATNATSQPDSVESAGRHPLNNFDINYDFEPPVYVAFEFVKTDNIAIPHHPQAIRLQNAGFQLYRRPDSLSPWVAVGSTVFSNPQGVVQFSLSTDNQYRLVEVVPPSGFQAPFGYWLLVVTNNGVDYVVSAITSHGGNPPFVQDPPASGNWWVGNNIDINLPLTGGRGGMIFFVSGSVFLGIAIVAASLIFAYKKRFQWQ